MGGAVAFGAVSLASMPGIAFADRTSEDAQAEADAAREKLDDMQSRLEKASNDYFDCLDARDAALEAMDECQAQIDANNEQIASLQDRLGTRARDMYRTGAASFIDLLLGSATFEEFATNWQTLQRLNESDSDLIQDTKDLRADNEAQHEEYAAQEQVAEEKLAEAEAIKDEAEALVEQYQEEVDSLDAEVAELVEKERQAAAEAAAEKARQEAEAAAAAEAAASSDDDDDDYDDDSGESSGGSSSAGSNIPAQGSVVDYAISQLGVPYVWGGQTPGSGFDCSGLTSWCWMQATGIDIGRTDSSQHSSADWVGSLSDAQPGDVLWTDGHVAVCTADGGGEYIHAPQPGQVVCYSTWSQFVYALRWA